MRRFLIIICLMGLVIGSSISQASMSDPRINGDQTAIVIDADSKVIYWQKDGDKKIFPASTTKVLTALVVLENSKLDEVVQVSDHAIDSIIGSTLWLEYGEKQTVENLLHGLLMVSANDAAVALAEHVSGSVEAFADKMNEKAISLGATNSHFTNPHGLHENNHYSTAQDMAIIFSAALNHPDFVRIANCQVYAMPWLGKTEERVIYHATLQALPYPWVLANKNGYTDEAGQTLVYGAEKDEIRFVAAIMGSQDIWNEMDRLLLSVREALESTVLIERNSSLLFGNQIWKTADDFQIAVVGPTEIEKNILVRLEPELGKVVLVENGVILSSGQVVPSVKHADQWYMSFYAPWLALLILPLWLIYFVSFSRTRSKKKYQ